MAKLLFVILISLLCVVLLVQAGKDYKRTSKSEKSKKSNSARKLLCYADINNPYVYFATKTAYRWNRNKNDDEITLPGCVAQQFWLLARHGTRNPGTEDMITLQSMLPLIRNDVISNHKAGRGSLCKKDIKNFEEWTFRANVTDDKFLTREGYKELKGIGDRFQDRFPDLLTKPFVNSSYIFKLTDSQRTKASARAFARGVFGKKDAHNVILQKTSSPDDLLRFDKTCDKWRKKIKKNPEALSEKFLYEQSEEFLSMTQSVSNRLGFISLLKNSEIDLIFTMCSFEKAWRPKKLSPWCAAFTEEDLKKLEYLEDLQYFYEDGYGHPINYEQACMPLKNVHDSFRQVVEGSTSLNPKGIFYFSHSGTVLKVMTRLGLFQDRVPLKHSNRKSQESREWRTSLINSFATNLALVLFNCSDGHRVTAYVQERPVKLPGCSGELCSFSDFSERYGLVADSCNLEEICRV